MKTVKPYQGQGVLFSLRIHRDYDHAVAFPSCQVSEKTLDGLFVRIVGLDLLERIEVQEFYVREIGDCIHTITDRLIFLPSASEQDRNAYKMQLTMEGVVIPEVYNINKLTMFRSVAEIQRACTKHRVAFVMAQ